MRRLNRINTLKILLPVILISGILSCKKDVCSTTVAATPPPVTTTHDTTKNTVSNLNALPINDYSTSGIYKGILCGRHSGNFELLVANGNNITEAWVSYNNIKDTLFTQDLLGWQPGSPVYAMFENTSGTGIALTVTILQDNSLNITINVKAKDLSDNTDTSISTVALKELSSLVVHTYEGTYTNSDSNSTNEITPAGKFNFAIRETQLTGIMYKNTTMIPAYLSGNNGAGTWQTDSTKGNFLFGIESAYMTGSFSSGKNVVIGTYQTQQTL